MVNWLLLQTWEIGLAEKFYLIKLNRKLNTRDMSLYSPAFLIKININTNIDIQFLKEQLIIKHFRYNGFNMTFMIFIILNYLLTI